MARLRYLPFLAFLLCGTAQAQVEVTASLDSDFMLADQTAKLTVTVTISQKAEGDHTPRMPSVPGLTFAYEGQARGVQQLSMNTDGRQSYQGIFHHVYRVKAQKAGKYEIAGIEATIGGQKYTAPPVTITVQEAQRRTPQKPVAGGQLIVDPARMDREFKVQFDLRFDRDTYYVGQAIVVRPTLLYPTPSGFREFSTSFIGQEHFPNCIVEYVPNSARILLQNQVVQGTPFTVTQMDLLVLYPLAPGEIIIDSVPFEFHARRGFLSRESRRVYSVPAALEIVSLPSEGRPEGFQGAVGRYQLETGIDRSDIEVGEAMTFSVTISGEGNIAQLPPPVIPEHAAFEQYEPTSDVQSRLTENGYAGRIRYEVLMVAREEGAVRIDGVRYPYFDPYSQQYVVLQSRPIEMSISAATGRRGERIAFNGGRREVELSGADFRHITVGKKTYESRSLDLHTRPGYLALLIVPFAVLAAAWYWNRHLDRLADDELYARGVRAPKAARKLLRDASTLVDSDPSGACAKLSMAVTDFIQDRWAIPARGITATEVEARLSEAGVSASRAAEVRDLLDRLARMRYGAAGSDGTAMRETVQQSERILGALMRVKT